MASIHVIKVPDVGEGVAEVELVAWHVKPGDTVAEDQGLADVMTDKASVEIPSPVAGRVLALGGEVGAMIAVGAELIRIELVGAGAATPVARAPAAPTQRAPTVSRAVARPAPAPAANSAALSAARTGAQPAAEPSLWCQGGPKCLSCL